MPEYYPIMLDIRQRKALVIGGNSIAAEKAAALQASGALVTVLSSSFSPEVLELANRDAVSLWQKEYAYGDLKGFFVVVAATTYEPELSQAIWHEGQEQNQLVNIVDVPKLCNFIVPSILRRGQLTISVSTEGSSPALAKRIRQKLEGIFPPAYEQYLLIATIVRRYLREQGIGYNQRDEFFGAFFTSDILELLIEQEWDKALAGTLHLLHTYGIDISLATFSHDIKKAEIGHEHINRA